jgi:hypothetical protein
MPAAIFALKMFDAIMRPPSFGTNSTEIVSSASA